MSSCQLVWSRIVSVKKEKSNVRLTLLEHVFLSKSRCNIDLILISHSYFPVLFAVEKTVLPVPIFSID